ncbi:hypothetical protein DOU17_04350 [Clavibacter michiganensis subsp. michiganensis]|nr:hypothetical protein [Clavibacter michiganensis subsp. michiganensis]MWJ15772.1 hypothetical protein [Clavibacter michiganensis subsp. michiganensis]MWJ18160.1 hypothetical protein [Clavibacter michiganensis subsp. michiganensis]MWJ21360.1 hypothetical protein [Clavibacter michiganensis subsp. michiganensis]
MLRGSVFGVGVPGRIITGTLALMSTSCRVPPIPGDGVRRDRPITRSARSRARLRIASAGRLEVRCRVTSRPGSTSCATSSARCSTSSPT